MSYNLIKLFPAWKQWSSLVNKTPKPQRPVHSCPPFPWSCQGGAGAGSQGRGAGEGSRQAGSGVTTVGRAPGLYSEAQRGRGPCPGTHSPRVPGSLSAARPGGVAPGTAPLFSQHLGTDGSSAHPRKPNIFPGYPANVLTASSCKYRVQSLLRTACLPAHFDSPGEALREPATARGSPRTVPGKAHVWPHAPAPPTCHRKGAGSGSRRAWLQSRLCPPLRGWLGSLGPAPWALWYLLSHL